MNIDANIQRLITAALKKWKIIIALGLIGAGLAYFYTANFTTLTYSSSVEFLAYAEDSHQELSESTSLQQTASNTSKMNYAIKMLSTYIEMFQTNAFNESVAQALNENFGTSCSASQIRNAVKITAIEDTSMFKVVVTTTDADLSYQIARQLETSIPKKMKKTNNGLLKASVEDPAIKAGSSESLGYAKKCTIGFLAGAIIAAAYAILRDMLDIRIKSSEELTERYNIPVLGTIPEFELKASAKVDNKAIDERSEN